MDGGGAPTALPPLDHPTIRYALQFPGAYPVITYDTLRCVTPRA